MQQEHRAKDWYWRLRANVEAAATQLIAKGAIVSWEYLPGCPPALDQSPGAAQAWLDATIRYTDPATVAASERKRLPATAQKRAELEEQARALREAKHGKRRIPRNQKDVTAKPSLTEPVTATAWKAWRTENGLQQVEAARRLGVDQSFISLVERGKRPISVELAAKLQALMDSPEGGIV